MAGEEHIVEVKMIADPKAPLPVGAGRLSDRLLKIRGYCRWIRTLTIFQFFSSLMLKNFSSHLTWKLSWTPFHKGSPLFQWTWTRLNFRYKRVYHSALQAMKHGSREQTLIEIGVYIIVVLTTAAPSKYHIVKFKHPIEKPTYKPNANMADFSAGPGLVARKRG